MTQKQKGPAKGATFPDHGSPNMEMEMNKPQHSTTATPPANINLQSDADKVWNDLTDIVHKLHFLCHDLEEAFRLGRGELKGDIITLRFSTESINARLWLTSNAWLQAREACARAEALADRIEKQGRRAVS